MAPLAWVAQLVEHSPEERRVSSSSLLPSTKKARISGFLTAWEERHFRVFRAGSKGICIYFAQFLEQNIQMLGQVNLMNVMN